jgi:hypothetical protein
VGCDKAIKEIGRKNNNLAELASSNEDETPDETTDEHQRKYFFPKGKLEDCARDSPLSVSWEDSALGGLPQGDKKTHDKDSSKQKT